MNDILHNDRTWNDGSDFEALLRGRLHELADHAPATVRQIDEIVVHSTTPRTPRRRIAGIGATIVALVGAAGITTVALSGADSGGAGTPNEAVLLFVEALQDEDVLGMIDVVDPAEVPAFRAAAEQGSAEAKRVDLLGGGFSLEGVAGVDLVVDGLTLATEQLTDDVAVVSATSGTVTTAFDPAAFPFGETMRQILGDLSPSSSVTEIGPDALDLRVATVQRDGRWYISLSYTIAEYARRHADVDLPPTSGVEPEGFDTPEAAVTALYQRLGALDFEGVVATAAPGEGDAAARYAPLWLPSANEFAEDARSAGFQLDVSEMTFESTGDGDRRTLRPATFVLEGTFPTWEESSTAPLPVRIERADGCTVWTGPGTAHLFSPDLPSDFEQIGDDSWRSCASSPLGVGTLLFAFGTGGLTTLPDIATVQVDGRWHISPLGTAAAAVVGPLQDVRDSRSLLDSALAPYLFGTTRGLLEAIYVGRSDSELPTECVPLYVVDASGTITAVVDNPAPALVRACNSPSFSESESGSESAPPPSTVVASAVPASTVPAETVPVETVPVETVPTSIPPTSTPPATTVAG